MLDFTFVINSADLPDISEHNPILCYSRVSFCRMSYELPLILLLCHEDFFFLRLKAIKGSCIKGRNVKDQVPFGSDYLLEAQAPN